MKKTRELVFTALLVSIALAVSLIESMIPMPFMVPGAKLGLSNMIILVTLVVFNFKRAFQVALLKSILLMLVTGFGPSFLYSFAGAIFSTCMMGLSLRYATKTFSIIGISIIGAVSHNLAQVSVASFMLGSVMVYTYFPFLTFVGMLTGYFVGLGAYNVSSHLKKIL
ncbi:MAG: Gx transporter family protein [Tissierellia bacterium]|nr:Gx transporter family protein [Tissierellia bacterium]